MLWQEEAATEVLGSLPALRNKYTSFRPSLESAGIILAAALGHPVRFAV